MSFRLLLSVSLLIPFLLLLLLTFPIESTSQQQQQQQQQQKQQQQQQQPRRKPQRRRHFKIILNRLNSNQQQQKEEEAEIEIENDNDEIYKANLLIHPKFLHGELLLSSSKTQSDTNSNNTIIASSSSFSSCKNQKYIIRFYDTISIPIMDTIISIIKRRFKNKRIRVVQKYTTVFTGFVITNVSSYSILFYLLQTYTSFIMYIAPDGRDQIQQLPPSRLPPKIRIQRNVTSWGLDRIFSPKNDKIYKYRYDGTGVILYVFDSGIQLNHTEFNTNTNGTSSNSRVSCGIDFFNENCYDAYNHGTPVAGIIGGTIHGVAKNVSIVSIRYLDKYGGGSKLDSITAIEWIMKQQQKSNSAIKGRRRPVIINMSVQGTYYQPQNDAIDKATKLGNITVIVAAGNSFGNNACNYSPSSATSAITVGASDTNDNIDYYSNVGPCVTIIAPGSFITSASAKTTNAIGIFTGTSFSTPYVTGVVALYLQQNNTLLPLQIIKKLKQQSIRRILKNPYFLNQFPNLLLNVKRFVQNPFK